MRAAGIIHRSLPACRFSVHGAALFGEPGAARYEADVRAAAAGLPIEFAGWARDIYQVLDRVHLLLVPSAPYEATTRVIMEAFAAGVPVIAFRSGGIPEIVDDGRTGFLVESAAEMAKLAIDLLGGDRGRLLSAGKTGRESWERRFNLRRFHQELFHLFADVARATTASPSAPSAAARRDDAARGRD